MPVFNNILAGASGATSEAAAFQIDRSLRFNDDDSAYLNRTPSSAGNSKTWTWSAWVKRGKLGAYQLLFGKNTNHYIDFANSDIIRFIRYDGSNQASLQTTVKFRDPSAWYHIVAVWDTDNSTANHRQRLYVNGEEITSFSPRINPSEGYSGGIINTATAHYLCGDGSTNHNDCYLADVHFIDGRALAATDFGEYDDNNVWQPKAYTHTVPTGDNTGTISVTAAGWGTLNNTVDADDTTKGSSSNNVAGTITFGTALVEATKVRAKTRFLGGGTAKLYNGSTEVHSVNHSADGTKYYTIYDGPPITITKYE